MMTGGETPAASGPRWSRRGLLKAATGIGAGAVFSRALLTIAADQPAVTEEMVRRAEWIAGLELTDDERKLMLDGVNELVEDFAAIRAVRLENAVPPALIFQPAPPGAADAATRRTARPQRRGSATRPANDDDLAFAPLSVLAELIRTREISSTELTRIYLGRLERFDPQLLCVVERTPELALRQAAAADKEIAAGRYRGPLHGVPWGAKDLLAVPGYRTTWGARPYQEQILDEQASVVSRMEQGGAVLVAKLTLGALAWGDTWYGGMTRNPWKLDQGSSGSSAGSSAATAAGLVGVAIGSETWGSIVSPCTRCGATGLRPTFGSISRHGAMALSWSMDKLGPIARSVEDCALVFDAIRGPDGLDPTVVARPFDWPPRRDVRTLRVGYVKQLFDEDRAAATDDPDQKGRAAEWQRFDRETLDVLRRLGIELVPIDLPADLPVDSLSFILSAEAATAFDELTRSGRDDALVRQVEFAWPNVFRQAQLIPAVEYLRANRIRTLVQAGLERALGDLDVYVCPSFGGNNLLLTNLTGHPCVVLPNGFRTDDGTPTSITFNGRLHGESELLALAHAYQQATDFHLARPPLA